MIKQKNVNIFSCLIHSDKKIIKITCNELNEEQDILRFKIIQTDKLNSYKNLCKNSIDVKSFYNKVAYPLKTECNLENLITLKDFKTYSSDKKISVNTHFSKSYQLGFITLKENSTISYLKYELMKESLQIVLKKYFQHKNEGCFFDKKTNLENIKICDFCEKQLMNEGLDYKEISSLKKLLETIRKSSLGIQESNLFAVIIMDIVGYSQYTDTEQKKMISKLQKTIISNSMVHSHLEDIIFLPTGDGCVIALSDSSYRYSIKLCANLQKSVKDNNLQVRFGLNFGSIFRYWDINQNINIAGHGINMAARVMDLGDANHIIANRTMYDSMANIDSWHKSVFHRLGFARVKHNVELEVFNIFSEKDKFGNPEIPKKFKEKLDVEK